MYVPSRRTCCSSASPKKFCRKPLMAEAFDICLTAEYLDTPSRERHSSHSSKSSTVWSAPCAACAAVTVSVCESMKAALAVTIERRHLTLPLVDISPVISESCSTSHTPTRSCRSSTRSHSSKPSLSDMCCSSESSLVFFLYHASSFGLYSSRTARTAGSFISLSRNSAEFSRLALGMTMSLSIVRNASGTATGSSLLPKRPKEGLERQKAMRTIMLRNSYRTSS
mmetsp:Transcript_32760/g.74039  ORF Transcript_32760/g.74039 Transcript_32760/m.74039 type:complete len:225 (-) Transcript_32760:573-1247(-)